MASTLSQENHIKLPQNPCSKSEFLTTNLLEKASQATMLSRRYDQLLRSEKYYDCVFYIEGIKVKCHKLILSIASPVFEAMFYGPLCEQQQEIEVLDISPKQFKILIEYIYVGQVDFNHLTLEETIELYYAAEKYLLKDLIDDCLAAVMRKLRFSNILPALELSVCMDLGGLLNVCISFFKRCCLSDPQYMLYLKSQYVHVSKECIKTIIAANKDGFHTYMLWFVYEWCHHECNGNNDYRLIIDDLQLNDCDISTESDKQLLNLKKQILNKCTTIERSYFKACRPFIIDHDACEWKMTVKSNRFISLLGIMLHSRLTPNMTAITMSHIFPTEYNENLRIEISGQTHANSAPLLPPNNSDGEESDQENAREQNHNSPKVLIWQHSINKKPTKYNCDLSISWDEGVTLSPDIEYEIKIIWQSDAFGAEYPCSLLSNLVDGIQFRDFNGYYGSLIKGLRFINLV